MSNRDEVRAFVTQTFYPRAGLRDADSLLDTGTIDSTGVLELVAFLEERFAIQVGDRDIHPDNFDSIDRVIAFVERKRDEGARPAEGPGPSATPS